MLVLTSMGLGCPNVSLHGIHVKERDCQHLGSCVWVVLKKTIFLI